MIAVGMDRTALCATRATVERVEGGTATGFQVTLSADDVKAALPLLKVATRDQKAVSVILSFEGTMMYLRRSDGVSASVRGSHHSFPDWRGLMDGVRERARMGTDVGYAAWVNPAVLTKFTKIKRRDEYLLIEPNHKSARGSIGVRVGTHSIGILMPVRVEDSAGLRGSWDALL